MEKPVKEGVEEGEGEKWRRRRRNRGTRITSLLKHFAKLLPLFLEYCREALLDSDFIPFEDRSELNNIILLMVQRCFE